MKIESLLFDLGKVVLNFDFESGIQRLHANCSISRERLEQILWDEAWIRRYERGEISTREFHAYLCQAGTLKMDFTEFCTTWSSVFMPEPILSEALLAKLKSRYPLICVSNTNEVHIQFVRERFRVLDYFDHHVFSYEVGSLKPDTKIFRHAIKAAGCPPEALFFTDDREENIIAARQLGMHAHQFVSEPKLIEALRHAGVEV